MVAEVESKVVYEEGDYQIVDSGHGYGVKVKDGGNWRITCSAAYDDVLFKGIDMYQELEDGSTLGSWAISFIKSPAHLASVETRNKLFSEGSFKKPVYK